MIAYLRGKPVLSGSDYVVIDVAGVGYKVFVPTPVVGALAEPRDECTLFTYLHVREDAMQLFGCLAQRDLEIFELLLGVSGIGPKVALAVLSAVPVESFVSAVVSEQVDLLTRIPGVGKKTAQRVIIELKDKLSKLDVAALPEVAGAAAPVQGASDDALQALIALGYNPLEARKALGKAVRNQAGEATPESLVRQALKELMR